LQDGSRDLWDQYKNTGPGSYPIIVDYEALLIEFSIDQKDAIDQLRGRIRVLYPRPSMWSTHPFLALSPKGERLIDVLSTGRDVHRLAWEHHGFRSGLLGVQNDPKVLQPFGLPEEIGQTLPMPQPSVMDQIIKAAS